MTLEIAGVGLSTVDHLYLLDDVRELPSGRVREFSVQGGGPAATAMAAASRLGAAAGLITAVGGDEGGRFILEALRHAGVDVSRAVVRPGTASPLILVLVDAATGERHFLGLEGEHPLLAAEEIDWQYAGAARVLHTDLSVNRPAEVLRRARALGLTTSVDCSCRAALEADWAPLADIVIAGMFEAAPGCEIQEATKAAQRIAARCRGTAVVTLGEAGCACAGPEGTFHLPAFRVPVADTCGAGDVFHGAYAVAAARRWPARESALFASAAAALSTTRLGGRAALPSPGQVAALLRAEGHNADFIEAPHDQA